MLPVVIIIFGWIVIIRANHGLESRKEIRKTVDSMISLSDKIYLNCCEYYSLSNEDHLSHTSFSITTNYLLLSHYMIYLKSIGIFEMEAIYLTNFKKLATGGYFQTAEFQSQNAVPNWKIELAASHAEFKFRLDKSYFDWSKRNFSSVKKLLQPSTK